MVFSSSNTSKVLSWSNFLCAQLTRPYKKMWSWSNILCAEVDHPSKKITGNGIAAASVKKYSYVEILSRSWWNLLGVDLNAHTKKITGDGLAAT